MSNDTKLMNLGEKVSTKIFGDVVVKELCFESIQLLAPQILVLIMKLGSLDQKDIDKNPMSMWAPLLASPDTLKAVYSLLAASMDKTEEEFQSILTKSGGKLPITDGLKLLIAFKNVNDLKELKELFFQLVPSITATLALKVKEISK